MKIIRRSGQFFWKSIIQAKLNKTQIWIYFRSVWFETSPAEKVRKRKNDFFQQKNVLIFLFSRFPARLRPTVVKTLLNANLVFPPLSHIMQISFRVNNKKVCLLPTLDSIQRNETLLKCYLASITQWIKFLLPL